MSAMASQITGLAIVYPTVYSGTDQRKQIRVTGPLWGEFAGHRWIQIYPAGIYGAIDTNYKGLYIKLESADYDHNEWGDDANVNNGGRDEQQVIKMMIIIILVVEMTTTPWGKQYDMRYSISQVTCIYPYSSGLLCWHWGNR